MTNEYNPDYAVPPSHTVAEILCERGLITRITCDVLCGAEITESVAKHLELRFSVSAQFWLNRDRNYRETLARIDGEAHDT